MLNLNEIQVFNLNLSLIRRFSKKTTYTILNHRISKQIMLVYQNEIIINQFNGCNGNSDVLTSILLDQNGYMVTSCANLTTKTKLYLNFQNGSFKGQSLTTPSTPYYIGFDSKGRFIQISNKQISIYD